MQWLKNLLWLIQTLKMHPKSIITSRRQCVLFKLQSQVQGLSLQELKIKMRLYAISPWNSFKLQHYSHQMKWNNNCIIKDFPYIINFWCSFDEGAHAATHLCRVVMVRHRKCCYQRVTSNAVFQCDVIHTHTKTRKWEKNYRSRIASCKFQATKPRYSWLN